MSAEERFWAKVDKTESCWLWTGAKTTGGYGWFRDEGGRQVRAHRWAYEALVGPIPAGLETDHLCRVRHCVNPAHLEPVTGAENTLRGTGPTATNAAKTHCDYGHEFTPENTVIIVGYRQCRTCRRRRDAESKRRVAAKRKAEANG